MHACTLHTYTNLAPVPEIELICQFGQVSPSSGPDVSCFTNVPYTSVSCSFDSGPPESCKFRAEM